MDDEFLSFTFDASFWRTIDLAGKDDAPSGKYGRTLDLLANALAPAVLRVGGTQGDYDVMEGFGDGSASCDALPPPMTSYRCRSVSPAQWASLLNFSARNGLKLVYGLNDMWGRPTKTKPETKLCSSSSCPARNQTNLHSLLRWTARERPAGWERLLAFELGNELNSCLNSDLGARAQAAHLPSSYGHGVRVRTFDNMAGGGPPRARGAHQRLVGGRGRGDAAAHHRA